jgi:hypothetical protein
MREVKGVCNRSEPVFAETDRKNYVNGCGPEGKWFVKKEAVSENA